MKKQKADEKGGYMRKGESSGGGKVWNRVVQRLCIRSPREKRRSFQVLQGV